MILQTDRRLRKEINTHGCYYMSIMFLVNKYTGLLLTTVSLGHRFEQCVELGYITNSNGYKAFIESAENIFRHNGLNVKYNNRHDPPKYKCGTEEIEILCLQYPTYTHFVVGDGNGNIAYNPMGITVPNYYLKSKRIFKLL